MVSTRISKLALAGAIVAVLFVATEDTKAGFSIRIGGIRFGTWGNQRYGRSYSYYRSCDDDWGYYEYNRSYRRPVYRIQPYYGRRRHFRVQPYRRHLRRHRHFGRRRR